VIRYYRLKNGRVLLIRDAKVSDANEIVGYMRRVTIETHYMVTKPEEVLDVPMERSIIKSHLNNPRKLMIVGVLDDRIVSLLSFSTFRRKRVSHSGELSLSVLKDYWGLGIGSAMMETLIEWARKKRIVRIQLEVLEDNERAINLYRKFGFIVEGRKRKAVRLEECFKDTLIMALILE